MTKTKTNLISAIAIIATIGVSFLAALTTQAAQGTSISPPNNEITADPGETITKTVTIQNSGDIPLQYKMVSNNFEATGENGDSTYMPNGTGGLADWISFSPANFSLAKGEAAEVKYTIEIPKNARAGGHYALLFAQASGISANEQTGSSSTTGLQVGANVLLNVTGNITKEASIAQFSTPRGRINAGEDVEFSIKIQNSGNVHIAPQGTITIFRKGVEVDSIAINETGSRVLPNSTRKYTVVSEKTLLPGPYTAVLNTGYDGGRLEAPSISFAVVGDSSPWMWITGILTSLLILLLIAMLVSNKKKK